MGDERASAGVTTTAGGTPAAPAIHVQDPQRGSVYALRVGVPVTCGRAARGFEPDIPCEDPHVSRRHCELEAQADGRLRLVDRSTYGTFVNGARLERAGHASPGDRIVLGHRYGLVVASPPVPAPLTSLGERSRLLREVGRARLGAVFEAYDELARARCAV